MDAPALYLPHPLAELFPMLPERELHELADDIVTFGQRVPIVLLDGMVLDGRNRLAACRFAEVEPIVEDYSGDDPLNFVLSHNLHRRHLSDSQRAMVAAKIVDWETGLNQHSAGAAHVPAHKAAERLSISERAVRAARRIHEHGAGELVAAIRDGRLSIKTGEALSHLERSAQQDVLRQEERQIVARAKEIRAGRQKTRHAVRLAHMEMVADKGQATAPIWWKDGAEGPRFPIILADPPWKRIVYSEVTGSEKSAENHYPTMGLAEILDLGCPAADDAALWLWVTDLANGLACMEAWGFAFKSFWGWEKIYPGERLGTGYWSFDNLELLLIGTRGKFPAPLPGTQPPKLTAHPVGAHSSKPDFYAETIERLYPGMPKLEMFSRAARPGWQVWGFEAGGAANSSPPGTGGEVASVSPQGEARDGEGVFGGGEKTPSPPQPVASSGFGTSPPLRGGEDRDALTPAQKVCSMAPGPGAPVEFTVGGMKKGSFATFGISLSKKKTYEISYNVQFKGHSGFDSPPHGGHESFAEALTHALSYLRLRFCLVTANTNGHPHAAAKAGIAWCDARAAEWGLTLKTVEGEAHPAEGREKANDLAFSAPNARSASGGPA